VLHKSNAALIEQTFHAINKWTWDQLTEIQLENSRQNGRLRVDTYTVDSAKGASTKHAAALKF